MNLIHFLMQATFYLKQQKNKQKQQKNKQKKEIGASIDKDPTENNTKKGE